MTGRPDRLTGRPDGADGAGVRPAEPAELRATGGVAGAALWLDGDEGPLLVSRLAAPPPDRVWTALVTPRLSGLVFTSLSRTAGVGHVDLLAVHPDSQGRGLGRALLRAAEEWLAARGVREVRLAGNPPCYAWPGIDVRYTPAACLAESLGYERYQTAWNMTADLTDHPWTAGQEDEEAALAAAGVTVREAPARHREDVARFVREHWNDEWAWEVTQAAGCHYAERDGEILGFAAWGARPRWFGPTGTAEAARGLGIGRVLLRRCLRDQADAGLHTTQISWVGPLRFYSRAVGARAERVFWLYRRVLPPGTPGGDATPA
ncbi:hypothetical protein Sru01_67600 [Sphaerisporangium rufum]|uniref:N-acetyltransferase domain-containing protein n=1 Tax=Sphaerisporangium rufum TaxID=1381558 RepID=A0A919V516_9ACTN|nr:GNAT family N-acetyltransferase [Sphaerisporangium rufum]GII81778.1 hypothetical protein Sru01_67600 [Sphaerisporangium rufum]